MGWESGGTARRPSSSAGAPHRRGAATPGETVCPAPLHCLPVPTRPLAALGALALLAALPASADEAAPPVDGAAARAPVERLYAGLLEAMKQADALGFEGRFHKLQPVVTGSYDLPFMAQIVLGHQWKDFSPEQQATWLDTFARLTVSTYADRFDGYDGERFEIDGAEPSAQGTEIVHTRLVRTRDEPVKLDYRMRQTPEGWRIIDVYLNGTVSELALRRSDYAGLLRKEGFEALLAAVRGKIAAAEAGTSEKEDAP
jgi:phospholipid transport system substrate-binding protein